MNARRLKISLQPDVLRWARERVTYAVAKLAKKIQVKKKDVEQWEADGKISLARIEKLAHCTHTPLGLLYLAELPTDLDELPIPDFRTGSGDRPHPSPDIIETVHTMQRRQNWMREELLHDGVERLSFVGSFNIQDSPDEVADAMKKVLNLPDDWAAGFSNWGTARGGLQDSLERAGILIFLNGIVGNNTHRKLDRSEFQGFALVDDYAPLIFINSADYKAAQMFTLAHELAHIFINESGVSKFKKLHPTEHKTEQFCDRVAAEFLVPREKLRAFADNNSSRWDYEKYNQIARQFKVSSIVVARRALDIGLIKRQDFFDFYDQQKKIASVQKSQSGGNFWNTQEGGRIRRPFGDAIKRAVGEGRLFYREAYHLTELKAKTFDKFLKQEYK